MMKNKKGIKARIKQAEAEKKKTKKYDVSSVLAIVGLMGIVIFIISVLI